MHLNDPHIVKCYINIGRDESRRRCMENTFLDAGIEAVERFPAFKDKWVQSSRTYNSSYELARALNIACAIRRARQIGAQCVVVFEDSILLASDFSTRCAQITLPADWSVVYLGCAHLSRPKSRDGLLVGISACCDVSAFAVNAKYFSRVIRALLPGDRRLAGRFASVEEAIAAVEDLAPVLGVFPNLTWRNASAMQSPSNGQQVIYSADGTQVQWGEAIAGLVEQSQDAPPTNYVGRRRDRSLTWLYWDPKDNGGRAPVHSRLTALGTKMTFAAIQGKRLAVHWRWTELIEPQSKCKFITDAKRWRTAKGEEPSDREDFNYNTADAWKALRESAYGTPSWITASGLRERYLRVMRSFVPSPAIAQQILLITTTWPAVRPIGIEIADAGKLEQVVVMLQACLIEGAHDSVFVVCANSSVRSSIADLVEVPILQGMQARKPDVACDAPQWYETKELVSQTVELFLLAECDTIIATSNVGAGATAAAIGGASLLIC